MIKLTNNNNTVQILTKCVWCAEPLNQTNSRTHTKSATIFLHMSHSRVAQGAYLEVEYIRNVLSVSSTLKYYADSGTHWETLSNFFRTILKSPLSAKTRFTRIAHRRY